MLISPINNKENFAFCQNTYAANTKIKPYPADSVKLSGTETTDKSKDEKTKQKISLEKRLAAATACIAAFGTIGLFLIRNEKNKILKLYKEKLIISNLPEKLNFCEFKTLNEAINFAKETLGIKHIDSNFTLEALNTAIRGLIDVSNANKGKVYMPRGLIFESPNEKNKHYIARIIGDINSSKFSNLVINKDYFDEKILNEKLDKALFYKNGNKVYEINEITNDIESSWKVGNVYPFPKEELQELIQKYYVNKADLSIKDKQKLFYSLDYGVLIAENYKRNPLEVLKLISKEKTEFLKNNNINLNFEELKNMNSDKLNKFLEDLVKKIEDSGSYVEFWYGFESPACIIHHEMGHLQDFAKNMKDLDIMKYKFSLKDAWNFITNNKKSRIRVYEVNNRWGSVSKKKYSKIFKENPEKFKKRYPDFYEFLTNPDIKQTAGKISEYAQSGIGEFIAETYARMIAGRPIPEDVKVLYKKYKGPELPA